MTLLAMFLIGETLPAQNANSARIMIDIERRIGEIDRLIYGNFIEHIGRCIYGGVFEPGSMLSDAQGFRKDVLKGTQALNTTIVRWPGGNFVSGYHWEDGIGPVDKRPTRIDLAWANYEDNSFGTDEFIDWCRAAKTEPYICINLGLGTLNEARNWVEYCNIEKGTYYSDLRIKNGRTKPHKNRTVLNYLRNEADYIALHHYARKPRGENSFYDFIAEAAFAEKTMKKCITLKMR